MLLMMLSLLSETAVVMVAPPPTRPALRRNHRVRSSRAKGDLVSLFSDADYPESALRQNEEGIVTVRLTVGQSGKPVRCAVTTSSRVPSLDAVTCRIFMERAHFDPARDKRGRPVIDYYSQRVAWRIPTDEEFIAPVPPAPLVSWQSGAIFPVDAAGVGACTLTDFNTPTPFRIGTCADLSAAAQRLFIRRRSSSPAPYRIQFSLRLEVGDKHAPITFGGTNLSRHEANLQIDPIGLVVACDAVGEVDSIDLALLCNRARAAPFEALPDGAPRNIGRRAVIIEATDVLPAP